MSALKCWAWGAVTLLALAQVSHAEMTVSQSNDPTARLDTQLISLFGQERSALGALAPGHVGRIAGQPQAAAEPAVEKPKPGLFGGLFTGAGKTAVVVPDTGFNEAWLASQAAPGKMTPELQCLATALYFEARGESLEGQAAVAEVILNRVESPLYPRTVCGVVNQGGSGGCQFSYTCDGRADVIRERAAWARSSTVAAAMYAGAPRDLTDGATHFHTPAVRPSWSRRFTRTAAIGSHIFYRQPVRTAMN